MRTSYGSVILLLCIIVLVSLGLTAAIGVRAPETGDGLSVMASFYPLYTVALNVVGSCDGVTVSCLTQPTAGCLHDYQLSPAERAALGEADVLIQNGAGMELFLEPIVEALPMLKVIDTSADIDLLACEEHEHGHEHEHRGHEHACNAHVWVDPARYAEQVQALCDGLCAIDPERAADYTTNTEGYLQKIEALSEQLKSLSLPYTHALLFHDSMAYAANALRLTTVGSVLLSENAAASAAELTTIADALHGKSVLLLYDNQYPMLHESLAGYADKAASVRWNTAVQPIKGVAAKDAWVYAMQGNIQALKEAAA